MTRITITIDVENGASVTMGTTPVRATQPPAQLAALPDEPPWPAETIPEAAARIFPEADTGPLAQAMAAAQAEMCPVHHKPWKTVPAGVSKKTGKEYSAFRACPERGCEQRPAA